MLLRHMTSEQSPYLSVVVTSRNDDHGGDPLKRLQAFINCFDAQCCRTGLDAEVIIVEWNPPPDKPRVLGETETDRKIRAHLYQYRRWMRLSQKADIIAGMNLSPKELTEFEDL